VIGGEPVLRPGPTAPGTVFEVRDGVNVVRMPPWRGRLQVAEPPRILGDVRVGAAVSVAPGAWAGGWGTELIVRNIAICDTPVPDAACRNATPNELGGPVRPGEHVFGAVDEGRWAIPYATPDGNIPRPAILLYVPPGRASTHAARPAGPTTAYGTPVRVAPNRYRTRASVPARATRHSRRLVLGTARCAVACVARLVAFGSGGAISQETLVTNGARRLSVPPATFPRRARDIRVTVEILDTPVRVSRRVTLPRRR
jgi:hypothetical protein